ncbi:MAG: adenosylcobinamide amidohydrolase [Chloroflexi bacterium]|nr:adenosylcobinamide amidohydrolase [Chloroflexota bacterium]
MSVQTLLPGIHLYRTDRALVLESRTRLAILSSAVVGGGWTRARYIVNLHVSKDYANPRPEEDLRAFAREWGISEPFVGLMTAVYLHRSRVVSQQEGRLQVVAVGTVGVSNPAAAGKTPPFRAAPGTINLILLVRGNLTPAAMVNSVITVTEAKTAVLWERGLTTPAGHQVTGTSTDAVVIAATGEGAPLPYAGPVTPVGWLMARAVRQILEESLEAAA